jgi:Pyridine nucleotide-disulphide oxidoreductase
MTTSTDSAPRVVIVGGGFGGLAAAKALSKTDARVVLIDRQDHHVFQPLLYQVATSALSPAQIASPIRGVLQAQRNTTVLLGEATGVRPAACVSAGFWPGWRGPLFISNSWRSRTSGSASSCNGCGCTTGQRGSCLIVNHHGPSSDDSRAAEGASSIPSHDAAPTLETLRPVDAVKRAAETRP